MRIIKANGDDNRPGVAAPIPNRDITVSQQVATLLAAANSIAGVMASVREAEKEHGGSKDGGVLSSAEASLIGIYSRLDTIIANDKNWSLERLGKLEEQLSILYDRHIAFLEDQAVATRAATAPHMKLSPVLVRLDEANWAAILGDINSANCILGVGPSVELALESFDRAVQGKPCPTKEEWIKKHTNEKQAASNPLDRYRDNLSEGEPPDPDDDGTSEVARSVEKIRRAKARKASRSRRGRKVKSHRKGNPGGA